MTTPDRYTALRELGLTVHAFAPGYLKSLEFGAISALTFSSNIVIADDLLALIEQAPRQTGIRMHRLITGLRAGEIDHRNRNGLDNRKENLRFATPTQNSANRVRKNKLGYRGVVFIKDQNTYAVQLQFNGKKIYKRGFATAEDAAREYDKISKELHGEFGIRNFED